MGFARAIVRTGLEDCRYSVNRGNRLTLHSQHLGRRHAVPGENIEGTFLVIYVNTADPDQVVLSYDQQQISRTRDIISFFSVENSEESWVLFPTDQEDVSIIFLYVPSFSTHTISISSVAGVFTGVTGMLLFLSLILVATLVFLGPVYHYYFKKSKE